MKDNKKKIWFHLSVGAYSTSYRKENQIKELGFRRIDKTYSLGSDIGFGRSYVNTTVTIHSFFSGKVEEEKIENLKCIGQIFYTREEFLKCRDSIRQSSKQFHNMLKKYDNC